MKCVPKASTDANTIKDIERRLEKAKQYLKTSYGLHCIEKSNIASHCISCALCNCADNDFKTNSCSSHPEKYHDCTLLAECLQMIENLIENLPENEEKEELKYDTL